MNISLKSRIADCIEHPTPARVILLFLGSMISLLLVSLALGQLNLPYYGKTVWDLGMAGLTWLFGYFPVLATTTASQFPFAVGALSVLWLTVIYRRVRRSGQNMPRAFDWLMAVLSLGLFVTYFACDDQTLPYQAAFFYRVALYCAIAVNVFCVIQMVAHFEDKLEDEDNGGPFCISLLVCLVSGIATGFRGGDVAAVSFFAFQLPNAILHLLANFGGLAMSIWFYEEVKKLSPATTAAEDKEPCPEEAKG